MHTHLSIPDVTQARVGTELAHLETQRGELAGRVNSLQAAVERGAERLDAFRRERSWNEDQLEQWAAAQRQKEEDNAALAKYRCGSCAKPALVQDSVLARPQRQTATMSGAALWALFSLYGACAHYYLSLCTGGRTRASSKS